MYILPHFLEVETKKLLKVKLEKVISNITNDFIENLFSVNPNKKYTTMILNLDVEIRKQAIEIIKETITIIDNLYYESDDRKEYFNRCNIHHRSIITIFGEIEFNRIYYYDKNDRSEHFYFIDTLFDFPAYDRYDCLVKATAIENAISTNFKKGAEITTKMINTVLSSINNNNNYHISRQDIYLWIKKWIVPKVEYKTIETDSKTLYIMIDEKYIHEQIKMIIAEEKKKNKKIETKTNDNILEEIKSFINALNNPKGLPLLLPEPKIKTRNYIMTKAFITFTGIEEKNNRRALKNKVTFLTSEKGAWDEFIDSISKIFDFKNFDKIKILSDAGTWIVNGIPNLKLFSNNELVYCLCVFHAYDKIKRMTRNNNYRRLLKNYIKENKKKEFVEVIKLITKDLDNKKKEKIESFKNYIIKYWNALQNTLKSEIGSSMESHISHNIAKYFSYEPKAYSKNRIQKYLKLHEYYENGINIIELYLKTHKNKDVITVKEEEISFEIFDKSSSNLPILYSKDSGTRTLIKSLIS